MLLSRMFFTKDEQFLFLVSDLDTARGPTGQSRVCLFVCLCVCCRGGVDFFLVVGAEKRRQKCSRQAF